MTRSRDEDLIAEQTNNQTYLLALSQKLMAPQARVAMSRPRNNQWTGTSLPTVAEPIRHPLVGRVGLDQDDDDVEGRSFYIGPWHVQQDGITVFSWAAPVASAFFTTRAESHPLCDAVIVRRSLVDDGDEIIDFDDDWAAGRSQEAAPFDAASPLTVPVPPRPAPRLRTPPPEPTPPEPAPPEPAPPEPAPPEPAPPEPAPPEPAPPEPAPPEEVRLTESAPAGHRRPSDPPMRAERAVRARLAAPRSPQLASVLSTLQADQYELVTRPSTQSIAIQGHPGTGKTIIAAHRAAFLTHPEREPGPSLTRVLLLGPTAEYARHVERLVRTLDPGGRVVIRGMAPWLAELAQLGSAPGGKVDGGYNDCEWWIGSHFDQTGQLLRVSGALNDETVNKRSMSLLYETVRSNQYAGRQLISEPERLQWVHHLPPFERALLMRRLTPVLASCALAVRPAKTRSRYDHVIVDEAQDLRPLEWRIVDAFNSGTWTLIGDINQRRTDWTYSSWEHLATNLGIADDAGRFEPIVFQQGFRSTEPIMRYASKLLPKQSRVVVSIQTEGPKPRVVRTEDSRLARDAISEGVDLAGRHPDGTVAIIGADVTKMIGQLRSGGWVSKPGPDHLWTNGDAQLTLLTPESARGLEFDGVVVVEPSAFPKNFGRNGPLYTSLTRANRELTVIYAATLPRELR